MTLALKDSRTSKSTVNIITGFISQIVVLLLNFLVRFIFIRHLGYDYLGINSLFTSILTIISVADLGFGSALGIVLYSSLAKKDEKEIAGLMNFFKKIYLTIGLIVTVAGLAIMPFVGYLVNTDANIPYLRLYFLFFLANTVSSYFISYHHILIKADQKNSVINNITTIVKVAKAILEIGVLVFFPKWFGLIPTYFSYLGVMVIATYVIGLSGFYYTRKKYPYSFDKVKVSPEKKHDIISTTKDLFTYKICTAFATPIDSVLVSVFVGTTILGIFDNYYLVFTTLMEFVCLISRNTISSFGNFVVERPLEDQKKIYFEIQAIYFAVIIFVSVNYVSLISPFIDLIFQSGSVLSPFIVFILGFYLIMKCSGELAVIFRETTRIYKKTKYISLVYTGLHIGLSFLLGTYFGLEGIILGNAAAYFLTNFWFEIFALFRWHFKDNPFKVFAMFVYVIAIAAGLSIAGFYICSFLQGKGFESFILSCLASGSLSVIGILLLLPIPGFRAASERIIGIIGKMVEKLKLLYSMITKPKLILGISIFAFLVLISLRDFIGIEVNKYLFFAVFLLGILLNRKEYACCFMLFVLPFSTTTVELPILFVTALYLLFTSFDLKNYKIWIVICSIPLFLFVYELILSNIYGGASLEVALRIFILLFILGIFFYDRKSFSRKHIYAFLAGCLSLLAVIAVNWLAPVIYGVTHKDESQTWVTFSHIFEQVRLGHSTRDWLFQHAGLEYKINSVSQMVAENPNNIGLISLIGLSTIFALYGTEKGKTKVLLSICAVLFMMFGLWSKSRSFILVLVLYFIYKTVLSIISKRTTLLDGLLYFFTITSIVSFIFLIKVKNLDELIGRFLEPDTTSGGGRVELFVEYLKFTFSKATYALFGVGCANLKTVSGIGIVPHTNFIQVLSAYGVIFFVCFVFVIGYMYKKTKRLVKPTNPEFLLYTPLIFAFIFTLTDQLFAPSIILIIFIPSMICLSYLNKDGEKCISYYANIAPLLSRAEKAKVVVLTDNKDSTNFKSFIASISKVNNRLDVKCFNYRVIVKDDLQCTEIENDTNRKSLATIKNEIKYFKKQIEKIEPNIIFVLSSSYKNSYSMLIATHSFKETHCFYYYDGHEKTSFKDKIFYFFFDRFYPVVCDDEFNKFSDKDKKKFAGIVNNYDDSSIMEQLGKLVYEKDN